jgi:distribution and morphology protein 10
MLDFMENVQHAFYDASHWNVDNSYGALNATARGPALRPIFFQTLC